MDGLGSGAILARSSRRRWRQELSDLLAAAAVMIAWFFVTFRIAGVTLNN